MDEPLPLESSEEMTKLQSPIPDSTSLPTVTTAEASSDETTTTKAESPRQQPQAVTMITDLTSFSTVHVQQSSAYPKMRPLLTSSASEPASTNPRKKLERSEAVRSTSPPLPPEESTEGILQYGMTNTSFESVDSGIVSEFPSRRNASGRTSKQGSFSRDNSFEYTDSTGADLNEFIIKTLRNPRDRKFVMKLEHDFLSFIRDPLTIYINYPPMTSYHRMIVHRVAAYFGMDHNVDQQTGKSVIINKSINTRIPEQRFADLVSLSMDESEDSEGMPRAILRRQNNQARIGGSTPPKVDSPVMMTQGMERSKSIEEREEEYVKARQRIFNNPGSRQSSQSSQSSKGEDMPQPQILTREEAEFLQQGLPKEAQPRIFKSRSFDERTIDKRALPGVRIMSNKMLPRSSSSPGTGAAAAYAAAEHAARSTGSPKFGRQQTAGVPLSGIQYWSSEGISMVAAGMPTGEVQMVQPGMVPVMAQAAVASQGGMMWSVSSDAVPQGIMLINPNTGTPALGPDGNPVIVQSAYQPMVLKPGNGHPRYVQPQPRQATSQQPGAAPYQQGGAVGQQQQPGQMMVAPQYVGMPQPVYMMQQPGRPPFNQPHGATEGVTPGQWQGSNQPMSPTYQEMGSQFAALSMSGQQQQEIDSAIRQHMVNEESAAIASSAASSPLYGSTMSQSSLPGQPGQVQYVVIPQQGMHPQQFTSGQPAPPHMVLPPGQQQAQAYVVAAQPPFPQSPYPQQYGINKDISVLSHARSQTPPTPPPTSSPVLSQAFNPQTIQMSSQISQHSHSAAPFRQQTPPQPMVPVVLSGNRAVPVGTTTIPNNIPVQVPSQHSPGAAFHPAVPVQTQFPPGQKRVYSVDRRAPKPCELYNPEMMGMAVTGAPIGQIPVAYTPGGEPVGIMHMDRNQYAQYTQQRFGQVPVIGNPGIQYQQYAKPKPKQHHKKSPRSSSQSEPSQGQMERQSSSKSSDSEGTQGNVLEVYDLPSGIKNYEADVLLEELKSAGAQIQWPNDSPNSRNTPVRAVFSSPSAAEQAMSLVSNPSYKLRYAASLRATEAATTAAVPSIP